MDQAKNDDIYQNLVDAICVAINKNADLAGVAVAFCWSTPRDDIPANIVIFQPGKGIYKHKFALSAAANELSQQILNSIEADAARLDDYLKNLANKIHVSKQQLSELQAQSQHIQSTASVEKTD